MQAWTGPDWTVSWPRLDAAVDTDAARPIDGTSASVLECLEGVVHNDKSLGM